MYSVSVLTAPLIGCKFGLASGGVEVLYFPAMSKLGGAYLGPVQWINEKER